MLTSLLSQLGYKVDGGAIASLERLVDELLRWNRRRNLTAIVDRNEVLEKHLLDSLTLLPFARSAERLLDIGSGAGFPSLPIKIVCPDLEVVSVDSVGKKIDFQRHVVRALGVQGFRAVHGRIEDLLEDESCCLGFDLVTARALCSLQELVVLAEPFLLPGGHLVAMKGPEGEEEFRAQREQLEQAGWSLSLTRLKLPVSGASRCLIDMSR